MAKDRDREYLWRVGNAISFTEACPLPLGLDSYEISLNHQEGELTVNMKFTTEPRASRQKDEYSLPALEAIRKMASVFGYDLVPVAKAKASSARRKAARDTKRKDRK